METLANFTQDYRGCNPFSGSSYIFTAWVTVYLLFLPVFLFVLYIGFNKWKKPQSSASGGLSHSDVFTLHMVAMEMISIVGSCVGLYGLFSLTINVILAMLNLCAIIFTGHMLFHSLTCVERYLAVVHPVTYLRLRGEGGVTIRNVSIALVWVISVTFFLIGFYKSEASEIYCFVVLVLVVLMVTYCSVYVLCVLIRPKPGEGGRHKKQIDQSKRTTVYTMVAILGVLLLRLIASVIFYCLMYISLEGLDFCVMAAWSNWFILPSSLVLPLLFLHRAGKLLSCCKILK